MKRFYFPALVACALLLGSAGCGPGTGPDDARPRVLATTTMLGDLVREIAGDHVALTTLMGPGVDPHLYKPTASDITALRRAEVIIYNGHFLEGRMGELLGRMVEQGKTVVAVAETLPPESLLASDDDTGHPDPHVWGDARLWARCAEAVAEILVVTLPEQATEFRANADGYMAKLDTLDGWTRDRIAEIPEARRVLITSHDAFGYFGRAYGLEVVGVQGLSTASEAGLADIAKVADLIRARGLPAVFVESSVSPGTIERISADTGVIIGGELFSDALGTPGDLATVAGETYDKGTYIGMLKHNVNTVTEALK